MKGILSGLLFATCLLAQTASLETSLNALQDPKVDRTAVTKQIVDAMMSRADLRRPPARKTVEELADTLTSALIGVPFLKSELPAIQSSLILLIGGTKSNLYTSTMFRDALERLQVNHTAVRELITRFLAVGEEIRGPDDFENNKLK